MAKDKLDITLVNNSSWTFSDLWKPKKQAELSAIVGAGS